MAGETAVHESISDPIQEFKIKIYFMVLDTIITELNDHFDDESQHLLKDLSLFSRARIDQVRKNMLPIDDLRHLVRNFQTLLIKNFYVKNINNFHLCILILKNQ